MIKFLKFATVFSCNCEQSSQLYYKIQSHIILWSNSSYSKQTWTLHNEVFESSSPPHGYSYACSLGFPFFSGCGYLRRCVQVRQPLRELPEERQWDATAALLCWSQSSCCCLPHHCWQADCLWLSQDCIPEPECESCARKGTSRELSNQLGFHCRPQHRLLYVCISTCYFTQTVLYQHTWACVCIDMLVLRGVLYYIGLWVIV